MKNFMCHLYQIFIARFGQVRRNGRAYSTHVRVRNEHKRFDTERQRKENILEYSTHVRVRNEHKRFDTERQRKENILEITSGAKGNTKEGQISVL